MKISILVLLLTCWSYGFGQLEALEETFPKFPERTAPKSYEELWRGVDPRKEPLETEVLKEREEDGVILKVVRYRVGVFKGKKAMLAGVYGYPKGGSNLPALVQIHGGGQYAEALLHESI